MRAAIGHVPHFTCMLTRHCTDTTRSCSDLAAETPCSGLSITDIANDFVAYKNRFETITKLSTAAILNCEVGIYNAVNKAIAY